MANPKADTLIPEGRISSIVQRLEERDAVTERSDTGRDRDEKRTERNTFRKVYIE